MKNICLNVENLDEVLKSFAHATIRIFEIVFVRPKEFRMVTYQAGCQPELPQIKLQFHN